MESALITILFALTEHCGVLLLMLCRGKASELANHIFPYYGLRKRPEL